MHCDLFLFESWRISFKMNITLLFFIAVVREKCSKRTFYLFADKLVLWLLMWCMMTALLWMFFSSCKSAFLYLFYFLAELAKINYYLINLIFYFFDRHFTFSIFVTVVVNFIQKWTDQKLELVLFHYHKFIFKLLHLFLHLFYVIELLSHLLLISL